MEIRLRKDGIDPKDLILIKKAITGERIKKVRMDKKQKILAEMNMALYGIKSLIIGYHSIFFHTVAIIISWKKIYKTYPNSREFVCVLLHDIGYLIQDEQYPVFPKKDKHPELGAKICNFLFGNSYYNLCIGHSRDYAAKTKIKISKLCYADKYAFLVLPKFMRNLISYVDGEIDLKAATENFTNWCAENCKNVEIIKP